MKVCLAATLAILAASTSACATSRIDDATRDGQPVIETTIGTILDAPEAWNDKWVRIRGYVNGQASLLYEDACAVKALSARKEDSCLDNAASSKGGYGRTFDENGMLIDLDGHDVLALEPETRGSDINHLRISPAVVVGLVDLVCWRWSEPNSKFADEYIAANPDVVPLFHFRPPEEIAYCYSNGGPHLDKVLISKGNSQ